jgi:hypothetical protein
MPRTSAKIGKQKKTRQTAHLPLDKVLKKPRRGRPARIPASWVRGRADNYRVMFGQIWSHVWPGLSKSETRQDVLNTLNGSDVSTAYALEFVTLADLILQVIKDRKFPKHKQDAQINFLADSLGGHGMFTPRSSRDICERERARIKKVHRILSYEYYIECSCGYAGHSKNHACPICEAEIHFKTDSPFDAGFLPNS